MPESTAGPTARNDRLHDGLLFKRREIAGHRNGVAEIAEMAWIMGSER